MSILFIISAPSGTGKNTLVSRLMHEVPNLRYSISHTTRRPRPGEVQGVHYHFVSRAEFDREVAAGAFLEHACVFGNGYGTHRSEYDRACRDGYDLVMDIDVQGAAQLKRKTPDAVSIFLLPPSRHELEDRLRHRSTDTDEVIQRRLQGAEEEVRSYRHYDYVLVNDDLAAAGDLLASIVKAERTRCTRMGSVVEPILRTFENSREALAAPRLK